jgi:hypothetical protein
VNKRDRAVAEVIQAWTRPGPRPELHRRHQRLLLLRWPTLARAIQRLIVACPELVDAIRDEDD